MAVRVMHQVWEQATDVQGSDLLVLLALADWANDDGVCWPSIPRLAAKARVSVRTAQYTIGRLVSRGYVRVDPGGGRRLPNRYTVQHLHPSSPQTPQPLHPSRGATGNTNGATGGRNGAIAVAPEPSIEPSIEPSGYSRRAMFPRLHTPSPAISATPTPAEAAWHAINDALDHWTPGTDLPPLGPDAWAVITALGGFAALSARRPPWPAVLGAYNRLHSDGAPTGGACP
jgi:hypothetical protein